MIGALKAKFQGYTVPMLFMTCVNSLAVVYFAILLPFLPAKTGKAEAAAGALPEVHTPLTSRSTASQRISASADLCMSGWGMPCTEV